VSWFQNGASDHELPGEIGRLLIKPTLVPFGGFKLGAGLNKCVARLDGAAARRRGEARRLQHQH